MGQVLQIPNVWERLSNYGDDVVKYGKGLEVTTKVLDELLNARFRERKNGSPEGIELNELYFGKLEPTRLEGFLSKATDKLDFLSSETGYHELAHGLIRYDNPKKIDRKKDEGVATLYGFFINYNNLFRTLENNAEFNLAALGDLVYTGKADIKNLEKMTWEWTLNILCEGLENLRDPKNKMDVQYKKFLKETRTLSALRACKYALRNGLSPEDLIFGGYVQE
ncbi:hypothetical protein E2P64_00100 [Candidatus Bathyarchaeota archaeon]|nr:hypothetical protein E2P64_00100 [Candidatus Bathyarchaeota archaeon]